MTNYYTGDPHFGHARILELCDRPFDSVGEMNETIIDNFNRTASASDTIYIVGDACLGKLDESLPLIGEIDAYTVLIPGNHDRPSLAYQSKGDVAAKIEKARERYLEYFAEVWLEQGTESVFDAPFSDRTKTTVVMSHYPYDGDSHGEDRHKWLRPIDRGFPIIHGHVHEEWLVRGRQYNVGVDVNDFQLVHEDTLVDWVNSL